MMIYKPFLTAICCVSLFTGYAQKIHTGGNNIDNMIAPTSAKGLFKTTFILTSKGALSFGLGYGIWQENPSLQYSLNSGIMFRIGKHFLGNYMNDKYPNDSRSKLQVNFVFTPMVTARLAGDMYVYQPLEPFYLGTPNTVYNRYKYSLTLGSSFVISPRGTYKNVYTTRNRTQQCAVVALNIKDFNFTMYDDYLPKITTWAQLGDNWDRYFTGGGFVRYRFSDELTAHLYSEVYTGINRANAFLNPDIISYTHRNGSEVRQNYANQDPGQEYFNASWFIGALSYTPRPGSGQSYSQAPTTHLMVGITKPWTMFSQNLIHNLITYDPANDLHFHHFLNRNNVPGNYRKQSTIIMAEAESNFAMY